MALRNFKRERFAFELYAGTRLLEAYRIAGYNVHKKSVAANARQLAAHPAVRKRIDKLFAEERPYIALQAELARREREIIAFSDIGDFLEASLDADGRTTVKMKDLTTLPRTLTAALKRVRRNKYGWVIEMRDKNKALRAIERLVDPLPSRSRTPRSR